MKHDLSALQGGRTLALGATPGARLLLLPLLLLPGGELAGQELAGQEAPRGWDPGTRALAGALLRLELALKERPPAPAAVAEVNQAFDRATLAFFAGQVQAVLAALDSLTGVVEPDASVRARQGEAALEILGALQSKGRILEGEHPPVPYRLHGPPPAAPGPFPLVVALHGAGGNEHMFLEAYGAGRLRELADSLGFVVVAPATAALAAAPGAFPSLLEAAAAEYPVDRSRVVVVGHSMGAGLAWTLARRYPEGVAAVACLAGPCGGGGRGAGEGGVAAPPPLLVVAGELDPLAPPARLEAAVAQGREGGVDIELRVAPGAGHTLMVGAVLEEVVSWLLTRAPG